MTTENTTVTPAPVLTPHSVIMDMLRRARPKAPGRAEGSMSSCSVCGKEHSRNDKRVNEKCPTHKRAYEGKYTERLALLEKAVNDLPDLVQRGQFNAEIQWLGNELYIARKEHNAYVPDEKPATTPVQAKAYVPVKIDEPAVCVALKELLTMLGGKAGNESDPLKLCVYIKSHVALLLKK